MHGLDASIQNGLGFYYVLCALANFGFAAHQHYNVKNRLQTIIWASVGGVFLLHAIAYLLHVGPPIPHLITNFINLVMNPISYFVLSLLALGAMLYFRKTVIHPIFGWSLLMGTLLFGGWAITDPAFRSIITKPDNVPIVMLIFSVGYFTWLPLRMAVLNDERIARGEPVAEKLEEEKVLVWPDLVYTELICMVIFTLGLVVWAVCLKAPLEAPASPFRIPNPSKAPWYFLGLQEMLVYFDPWMAGVVLPSMIIVGLIAIPYIDFNPKGNGYYSFNERKFAIISFLLGFIILWVVLIVLGTILRGPNWNFFGPFETWNSHKNEPLNNVNLSELFWLKLLGRSPDSMGWLLRELPGILLMLGYLLLLPPILAKTIMREYFIKMGFIRFFLLVTLIQFMALLPIKMLLRWTLDLKYIVFIPEFFFNI